MQFRPSVHSYADPMAFGADPALGPTPGAVDNSALYQQAGQLTASALSAGLESWRGREEARLADWKRQSKKKKKSKAKIQLGQRGGGAPPTAPTEVAPPASPGFFASMSPLVKWSLFGAGAIVVGLVAWRVLRKKKEPKPKAFHIVRRNNPKRTVTRRVTEAPRSSAMMFRDQPTEQLVEEVIEETHGDSYDAPEDFEMGEDLGDAEFGDAEEM